MSELLPFIEKELGEKLTDSKVLNRIGYYCIESDDQQWAVPLLKLNVSIFPVDGNLWDSLGEAYAAIGDKTNAIKSFEKALELKPEDNCGWCENSKKRIQELSSK